MKKILIIISSIILFLWVWQVISINLDTFFESYEINSLKIYNKAFNIIKQSNEYDNDKINIILNKIESELIKKYKELINWYIKEILEYYNLDIQDKIILNVEIDNECWITTWKLVKTKKEFRRIELNIKICWIYSNNEIIRNKVYKILLHELWHYFYFYDFDKVNYINNCFEWDKIICNESEFVDKYAKLNKEEYYAETFMYDEYEKIFK